MRRIERIFTDKTQDLPFIRKNPFNPFHPRSHPFSKESEKSEHKKPAPQIRERVSHFLNLN